MTAYDARSGGRRLSTPTLTSGLVERRLFIDQSASPKESATTNAIVSALGSTLRRPMPSPTDVFDCVFDCVFDTRRGSGSGNGAGSTAAGTTPGKGTSVASPDTVAAPVAAVAAARPGVDKPARAAASSGAD